MTNYQLHREDRELDTDQVGRAKRDDEDCNSTVDDSDDFENNPASEANRRAVQAALSDHSKGNGFHESHSGVMVFSLDEVKTMVLASIPMTVRSTKPAAKWDRMFDDAAELVLGDDDEKTPPTTATSKDIKDIISFISATLQREAHENQYSESTRKLSPVPPRMTPPRHVDAVTLTISAQNDNLDSDHEDDSYSEFVRGHTAETRPPTQVLVSPEPEPTLSKSPSEKEVLQELQASHGGGTPGKLSFTLVEIRYYEQILSDNPAVRSGPPIGIGWRYKANKELSVDAWEESRQWNRRNLTGLMTSRHERYNNLKEIGYTRNELAKAVREVIRVKNGRKQTYHNMAYENIEIVMESITKKMKNLLTLGVIHRQEKQLLKPYRARKESRRP